MANIFVTIIKVILWAIAIFILYKIGMKMYDEYDKRFNKDRIERDERRRQEKIGLIKDSAKLASHHLDKAQDSMEVLSPEIMKTSASLIKDA
jgi:hypothetical protein